MICRKCINLLLEFITRNTCIIEIEDTSLLLKCSYQILLLNWMHYKLKRIILVCALKWKLVALSNIFIIPNDITKQIAYFDFFISTASSYLVSGSAKNLSQSSLFANVTKTDPCNETNHTKPILTEQTN